MNDDCYIKIEVKYSPDAERDGFCSMWTSKLLDRHNAYKVFNHLAREMQENKKNDPVYTVGLFDELVKCRRERDALSVKLDNSDAQLGEANNKIAELRTKLMNADGLQRELDGKKREMEWMKQSLRSFMDEDGLGVDG